ncbi:hypothetical protein E3T23_14255 [Cryobacterium cheniae]|uniref:Neutral/alkaline non-lysosomal ceramidase N-terminal domain-containing protein n=1 Tax=Cryobacterium cheniae TaxID=1259262 RepID=A0A4R8XHL9_9MICO|nr:hypothetical protein [Cryobacterium cheniae]TFC76676.1 hypothetical protein E3T23_14255 [Cryobacterium cheniae]
MSFQVSTAKVGITPTLDSNPYMAGYGVQSAPRLAASSDPYREPLYARCVILWDDSYPNALITLDLLGIPRSMNLALRPRLLALAGWSDADITLQATHTHNGPALVDMLHPFISYGLSDLTLLRSYSSWLQDKIVEVVTQALNAARTPVTLDYKVTNAGFAVNRVGLPTVEKQVPVLTARRSNGAPRAVIFSYGCHPVSAGWRELFDGDWPAGACTYIENARPGCFAMFLQGPAGDQDPAGVRSWALRDAHSSALGSAVSTAAGTAGRALSSPIQTSYEEVNLPLDILATDANLAAVRAAYVQRLDNPAGQPAWFQRHAQVMISRIDSDTIETSIPTPIQVWKLQGSPILRIALTGGELVSGYGAYFRSRFGGANGILVGGYANEVSCYVPANNFFPPYVTGGSYEGGWDLDSPGIAGGSMTVYPHLAHLKAGAGGVESTLIAAVTAQLS